MALEHIYLVEWPSPTLDLNIIQNLLQDLKIEVYNDSQFNLTDLKVEEKCKKRKIKCLGYFRLVTNYCDFCTTFSI